ncbi:MAG: DUF2867 domain-containing protein [Nocardioidaceae bacterium]
MTYVDRHRASVRVSPERAWEVVGHLGGDPRFYVPRRLWRVRLLSDLVFGGPGFTLTGPDRRLRVGDRMDFWEVVAAEPPARLRLRALSSLPGTADVEISLRPAGAGSELSVRTEFDPRGLAGHGYWLSSLAAHTVVFELMTRRLAAMIEQGTA